MAENIKSFAEKHAPKEQPKLSFLFAVLLLALLACFGFNLSRANGSATITEKEMEHNIDVILSSQIADVSEIEGEVDELDQENRDSQDQESLRAHYQKKFKSAAVVGDSLTEGLSVYGWLTSEQVFSEIGASVLTAEDLFASAAAVYPKTAFFAFGMNDMGNYGDSIESFTGDYRALIEDFKKKTPSTTVYVCSITTPTDEAIEGNASLGRYQEYNKAISKMCEEMGIRFIDVTDILPAHPEFYAGDGIHASPDYYPYWMDRVLKEARKAPVKAPSGGKSASSASGASGSKKSSAASTSEKK